MEPKMLSTRHIQNMSEAKILQPHWGYADRALPCTNDAGSCEYLDVVYHSHDLGMLYAGIIWSSIGAILLIWTIMRLVGKPSGIVKYPLRDTEKPSQPRSSFRRAYRSVASTARHYLLPESLTSFFGRTTRLQVLILFLLVGYLTLWTFLGITYKKWITPVKNSPLYNTRTSLGPWADRVGLLAYALIPLSILLSSRESILSLLTGIHYQHFNFIHRWLGYVIFAQSILHTVGWCVIETRLYQPQPKVAKEWIQQKYMIWGIVAQFFLLLLFIFSLRPIIKITGYEFFRKIHYIIAMLFIGACWGHWEKLKCFLLPSLLIWFLDRAVRLMRMWLLHYGYFEDGKIGFQAASARIAYFPDDQNGDVVRLDFEHLHGAWNVGEHFYLCFPELSIWQSHPFTPCSLPRPGIGIQSHSYVLRAKKGQTKSLARLAAVKKETETTPVILTGPYGGDLLSKLEQNTNVLCVAGGTGITFVLPVLLHLAGQRAPGDQNIELIWAVRQYADVDWIQKELSQLGAGSILQGITVKIFVTREDVGMSNVSTEIKQAFTRISVHDQSSCRSSSSDPEGRASPMQDTRGYFPGRPDLQKQVQNFVDLNISGSTVVYASGPGSMLSDLKTVIASCNSGRKVWQGDEKFDISLVCDDRLEW